MTFAALLPTPRKVAPGEGALVLERTLQLRTDPDLDPIDAALSRLERSLEAVDIAMESGAGRPGLRIDRSPTDHPEGYRLAVRPEGIELSASTAAGASHGLSTLAQLIRSREQLTPGELELPAVVISDQPALDRRGVLLDISRSRVPTMETLFDLVDRLASWKINELQLYMEHTFAYRGHEVVWRDASPMTADEIRHLDRYCRERHIDLVPNQNSFGHLHRWLAHDAYRHLAETPEGLPHPFSDEKQPFSLCPTDPECLELLSDLYAQLLPSFSSSYVHIGFDETIDLGKGRSKAEAEKIGVEGLYAGFLNDVHHLIAGHDKRLQLWGDIVASHPALLAEIPTDAVVMDWGYEADHPFAERAEALADAGLDFYLCPGTSSWLSFGGRVPNAVENIRAAALAAERFGARGCLTTDWGDMGHLQPLPISLPGLLAGAAFSWAPSDAEGWAEEVLEEALELHALPARPDSSSHAQSLLRLGSVYSLPGGSTFNGSPLFHLLVQPGLSLEHQRLSGLTAEGLEASLDLASEPQAGQVGDLIGDELAWVAAALTAGATMGLERLRHGAVHSAGDLPATSRSLLVEKLDWLIERHEPLWRARSRPGGRLESVAVLQKARDLLL